MAVLHYLINKKQFAKMYIECAWVGSKRLAEDSRDARVKRVLGNGTGRGAGYSTTCMHLLLLF